MMNFKETAIVTDSMTGAEAIEIINTGDSEYGGPEDVEGIISVVISNLVFDIASKDDQEVILVLKNLEVFQGILRYSISTMKNQPRDNDDLIDSLVRAHNCIALVFEGIEIGQFLSAIES